MCIQVHICMFKSQGPSQIYNQPATETDVVEKYPETFYFEVFLYHR